MVSSPARRSYSNAEQALPPRAVIEAALRRTTEALASELAHPTADAPDWSEFEWRVARAASSMHGVSALLARSLRWRGPIGWLEFLEDQRQQTLLRHEYICALLRRMDECARDQAIAVIALKGAELYARGLYVAGERPMADVDVLVEARACARAVRAFESLGFRESFVNARHRLLEPPAAVRPSRLGEHADNYIKIEVHERLHEPLKVKAVEVTPLLFTSSLRAGLNPYPSRAVLMLHLLLHAAGAMADRTARLIHLNDLIRLAERMDLKEWSELLQAQSVTGPLWWVFPPLQLADRYFPGKIPADLLREMAAQCPRRLRSRCQSRTLSDVSLSNPRIAAFPGIEWSASLTDGIRYIARRIRPSAAMLAERSSLSNGAGAPAPSRWHQLSQSARILHWIIARPARAESLRPIHISLGQPR